MIKRDELALPDSCLNKAADDEPVFVIRAKDAVAMATVMAWSNFRIVNGMNKPDDAKIQEATAWCNLVAEWRTRNGYLNNTVLTGLE